MKVLALVLLAVAVGAATWVLLIPPGTIYVLHVPLGFTISISRGEIHFDSGPDHFASNGFEHIGPYVKRLLGSPRDYRFLQIFTPDEKRGFGLIAQGAAVEASFILDSRNDVQREATVRFFFDTQGIAPTQDYVPDATWVRILHYPISGDTSEVTVMTKRILQELYGVSPQEALEISYGER